MACGTCPKSGVARVSGEALTVALSKSMHADLVKTIPVCENADASRCRGLVLRIRGLSKTLGIETLPEAATWKASEIHADVALQT